jgi:hypothetical protein
MVLDLGDGDLLHINAIERLQRKYFFGIFHSVNFKDESRINGARRAVSL